METNHSNEDRWIADRFATLEPAWRPNLAHGRELLDARLAARARLWPRSWAWVSAAAMAAACIAALALPGTRVFAQELWYRFVLNRVDVVRVDLSKLPLHLHVTTNGLEQSVPDLDAAERKAGFTPHLPPPGVLATIPNITVSGPINVEQTVHVSEIESALRSVGASDVQVPSEWEGTRLRTHIGPTVEADYQDSNNVQILQVQPIVLSVPNGFPLDRFTEVAFRSIGVSSWQAHAFAKKFGADPAWLLDVPDDVPDDQLVNIQEVELQAGRALLMEKFDNKGNLERAIVIRTTSDRMYSVSSRNPQLSVQIMNALP